VAGLLEEESAVGKLEPPYNWEYHTPTGRAVQAQ
jgi:hypothetical protein